MLRDHVIPMKLTSLVDKSVGYIITLLFYCFKFSNVVWLAFFCPRNGGFWMPERRPKNLANCKESKR